MACMTVSSTLASRVARGFRPGNGPFQKGTGRDRTSVSQVGTAKPLCVFCFSLFFWLKATAPSRRSYAVRLAQGRAAMVDCRQDVHKGPSQCRDQQKNGRLNTATHIPYR